MERDEGFFETLIGDGRPLLVLTALMPCVFIPRAARDHRNDSAVAAAAAGGSNDPALRAG